MPVSDAMSALAKFSVDAAYISPTSTGLAKSIIDAHVGVRFFLSVRGIHEFDDQEQGPANKVTLPISLVMTNGFDEREIFLYRPKTKAGDPRLWVSRFGSYVRSGNLIALITDSKNHLYAVNCSDPEIFASRNEAGSPLQELLTVRQRRPAAGELLRLLLEISKRGPVETLRQGDTGVGFTLESLLGIRANSSRQPDFRGIELKSGRVSVAGASKTRGTLFSKTPDWENSELHSGFEILDAYGYLDRKVGTKRLYCTVSNVPNAQRLYFAVSEATGLLENLADNPGAAPSRVVQWPFEQLHDALAQKHKETFWVKATTSLSSEGVEQFHYVEATHTRSPLVANFVPLIEGGKVTMDYTLQLRPSGVVRDHGYLFKINARDLGLLFPTSIKYDLVAGAAALI